RERCLADGFVPDMSVYRCGCSDDGLGSAPQRWGRFVFATRTCKVGHEKPRPEFVFRTGQDWTDARERESRSYQWMCSERCWIGAFIWACRVQFPAQSLRIIE